MIPEIVGEREEDKFSRSIICVSQKFSSVIQVLFQESRKCFLALNAECKL